MKKKKILKMCCESNEKVVNFAKIFDESSEKIEKYVESNST